MYDSEDGFQFEEWHDKAVLEKIRVLDGQRPKKQYIEG